MIKFIILFFLSLSVYAENNKLEKILVKLNSFNADFTQIVKDSTDQTNWWICWQSYVYEAKLFSMGV